MESGKAALRKPFVPEGIAPFAAPQAENREVPLLKVTGPASPTDSKSLRRLVEMAPGPQSWVTAACAEWETSS